MPADTVIQQPNDGVRGQWVGRIHTPEHTGAAAPRRTFLAVQNSRAGNGRALRRAPVRGLPWSLTALSNVT
jgi:hypothetical protein